PFIGTHGEGRLRRAVRNQLVAGVIGGNKASQGVLVGLGVAGMQDVAALRPQNLVQRGRIVGTAGGDEFVHAFLGRGKGCSFRALCRLDGDGEREGRGEKKNLTQVFHIHVSRKLAPSAAATAATTAAAAHATAATAEGAAAAAGAGEGTAAAETG